MNLSRPVADAPTGVAGVEVNVVSDGTVTRGRDVVTVEEPLEIRLVHGPADQRVERSVAVTMRTPGDDVALVLGFLHGEGVLRSIDEVTAVDRGGAPDDDDGAANVVRVELAPTAVFDADALTRNVYTTSSCGVCGKASIDAVRVQIPDYAGRDSFAIDDRTLGTLPERLRQQQEAFAHTGGLHASGTFDASGRIDAVAEDVGRHNALDKLLGGYLSRGDAAAHRAWAPLQRPRQLRAGPEGSHGRLPLRGCHRAAIEPGGRARRGATHDAGGLPARASLQHLHHAPPRDRRDLSRPIETR